MRKLCKSGCWDEAHVQEWDDVAQAARAAGSTVHIGTVFEICAEKGAELARGDPSQKFKGRVAYQGNNVKDDSYDLFLFSNLSSAPSSMDVASAVDAYGLFTGNVVEQSDADQA